MSAPRRTATGKESSSGNTSVSRDARDLSRTSVQRLVASFEDCTLPRSEWTHAAHLIVGLWYVLDHGAERAATLMSSGIQRYNAASGRTEAERKGYSALATRTWIQRIAEFARRNTGDGPEGTLFRRILTSPLAVSPRDAVR